MDVELQINNSPNPKARFVSWVPSPCRIRVTNPLGALSPIVNLKITGVSAAGGGAVVFRSGTTGAFANSVTLPVPTNGTSVPFFVAGKFGRPSTNNGDVTIQARRGTTLVGSVPVMVRIRKNANTLTTGERNRFVAAFAQLNNQGLGRFADFRNMHVSVSLPQAHGAAGFLPWHRAYLLDLERELQAIDASVALPYWRFDQPAPNIFTSDFFGASNALGTVQFAATNPLQFWKTDGVQGVNRRPLFNTATAPPGLRTEAQTLAIGTQFPAFRTMEGNPHGFAHTSFGGSIQNPATAPKDPLFFLLHCNVDRLWAKWQRQNGRFNPAVAASYDSNPTNQPGHNLPDTMWPWNGVTGGTRPPTAPGGAMAASPSVGAPGPQPRVQDCLDYQGAISVPARMGFDYDDAKFA
jgi:tyrosinase